jgi:hypothetical protein
LLAAVSLREEIWTPRTILAKGELNERERALFKELKVKQPANMAVQ